METPRSRLLQSLAPLGSWLRLRRHKTQGRRERRRKEQEEDDARTEGTLQQRDLPPLPPPPPDVNHEGEDEAMDAAESMEELSLPDCNTAFMPDDDSDEEDQGGGGQGDRQGSAADVGKSIEAVKNVSSISNLMTNIT